MFRMGFEVWLQSFLLNGLCTCSMGLGVSSNSAQRERTLYKNKNSVLFKIEPDVNRTRNLLIWSQTRYHCATDPLMTFMTIKY